MHDSLNKEFEENPDNKKKTRKVKASETSVRYLYNHNSQQKKKQKRERKEQILHCLQNIDRLLRNNKN